MNPSSAHAVLMPHGYGAEKLYRLYDLSDSESDEDDHDVFADVDADGHDR